MKVAAIVVLVIGVTAFLAGFVPFIAVRSAYYDRYRGAQGNRPGFFTFAFRDNKPRTVRALVGIAAGFVSLVAFGLLMPAP